MISPEGNARSHSQYPRCASLWLRHLLPGAHFRSQRGRGVPGLVKHYCAALATTCSHPRSQYVRVSPHSLPQPIPDETESEAIASAARVLARPRAGPDLGFDDALRGRGHLGALVVLLWRFRGLFSSIWRCAGVSKSQELCARFAARKPR
jgi:hypothetical protein